MGKYQNIKLCAPFECSHDYMVILIPWTKYFCKILHGQYGHRNNIWKKDLWLKYRSTKVRATFRYSHDDQMWIFISQVKYFCKTWHSTSQAFYTVQGHLKQSSKQEGMTKNWKASFLKIVSKDVPVWRILGSLHELLMGHLTQQVHCVGFNHVFYL